VRTRMMGRGRFRTTSRATRADDTSHGGPERRQYHLVSGLGNDTIFGDEATDFIHGNEGTDTLYGGAGVDENLRGTRTTIRYSAKADPDKI